MSEGHTIRALDLADPATVERLLALQRASYAVEARLVGSCAIPALRDTPGSLAGCGETFYGLLAEGNLVGAVSFRREGATLDIHRLVVHPAHFRKGIARKLVERVEREAGDAERIIVSTGTLNGPALGLYRTLGFRETGEIQAAPDLGVSTLEKRL